MVCALGICVSYITYGFIQEECFGRDNKVGSVNTFILITQSITNVWVAKVLMLIQPHTTDDSLGQGLNHRLLILSAFFPPPLPL